MPIRLRSVVWCPLVALIATACSGQRAGGEPAAPVGVPMPVFQASATLAGRAEPAAPWTLTASDGSGLLLTRVDARAVFQGPLAFTELHLYFHNPEPRIREGTFAITLPAHAAVSRFAMASERGWMEAEVVEKVLARRAYEDFLHRRQDPALLEKAEGNQFTARVFPIPAGGDKHLVISFSQELPGERYVLPLRGLPRVERFDAHLDILGADGRHTEQTMSQRNWLPDRDLVSELPVAAEAVTSGTMIAAQVAVRADGAAAADVPSGVTLLVDTSASRSLGFAVQVAAVHQLIGELARRHGDDLPVQVIAFDQDTRPIFAGHASDWGDAQDQQLIARGAAGASDLGQAIAWLGGHAPHARLVLIGDAVITAGATPDEVAAQLGKLHGAERLDVMLTGGIRDDAAAARLVRALPRAGAAIDLDAGIAAAAEALDERVLVDVPVDVAGATWVYPRTIPSARAGARVMVYARLPQPVQTVDIRVGGGSRAVGLVAATPALVQHAASAAEIAELDDRLGAATGDAAQALRADLAKRSIAARVVSSQTSLLVLETERDYARYGIDRKALADVMVIGAGGLELQHRAPLPDPAPVMVPRPVTTPPMPHRLDADYRLVKPITKFRTDTALDELMPGPAGSPAPARVTENEMPAPGPADLPAPSQGVQNETPMPEDHEARAAGRHRLAVTVESRPTPSEATIQPRPPASPAPSAPPAVRATPPRIPEPPGYRPRAIAVDGNAGGAYLGSRGLAVGDQGRPAVWPSPGGPSPLTGELADIERALAAGDGQRALATARAWHERQPGDVLALIGLGDALEANHQPGEAARIYGSIIDLFPARADLRRFAGERLERVGAEARALAIDTYHRAALERPDHLTGHRLYAYALLRAGRRAEAFAAILAGIDQPYPPGRFRGGDRVLAEDAGLIGAAWIAAEPAQRTAVTAELDRRHLALAISPSTRFVLYWETDANDVDFHILDGHGGHAWYGGMHLPSGGELYADVTTGYGPECFTIPGTPQAGPYRLSINYYAQGPMGYGMGLVQILRHDGQGGLVFEDRPYVIMTSQAYVDLGGFSP